MHVSIFQTTILKIHYDDNFHALAHRYGKDMCISKKNKPSHRVVEMVTCEKNSYLTSDPLNVSGGELLHSTPILEKRARYSMLKF